MTTASRDESPKFSMGLVSVTSSGDNPVTSTTQLRSHPRSCSTVIEAGAWLSVIYAVFLFLQWYSTVLFIRNSIARVNTSVTCPWWMTPEGHPC